MSVRKTIIMFIFLLALSLSGCVRRNICFYSYHSVDGSRWSHDETVELVYNRSNTADSLQVSMDLDMELRFLDTYRFRNIRLEVSHNALDSNVFVADTVEYMLADEKGNFLARGWSGIYTFSAPYKRIDIRRKGDVTFRVRQLMQTDSLRGITDVGLKGERIE